MKEIVMAAVIISVANKLYSQVEDSVFSFNYTMAPTGNDGVDFYVTDFAASIPIKTKKGLLTNSVGFGHYDVCYNDNFGFTTESVSDFYNMSYGLMYAYPLSHEWILSAEAKTSIVSNLEGSIDYGDLFLFGELSATRKIGSSEKNASLTLGVNYSAVTGKPRVLPTVSYIKSVNEKFSYGIGFPKTFTNYKINNMSSLKSFLMVDGLYANLNTPTFVNASEKVSKASLVSTSFGVEYNYVMDDFWMVSFKTGYSFYNNYTLTNPEGNKVIDFNTKSQPFFATGIKLNLKNIKKANYEK